LVVAVIDIVRGLLSLDVIRSKTQNFRDSPALVIVDEDVGHE
jgi:hypothetical protein